MGHQITAIITKNTIDAINALKYDLKYFFERGFYIIALDVYHIDYWSEKLNIIDSTDNAIIIDCKTTHFFAKQLNLLKYAIVETDYFGGIGSQTAVVYENDKIIMKPDSINKALHLIGVVPLKGLDEFDTINLSKYRHFVDLYEKYWEL